MLFTKGRETKAAGRDLVAIDGDRLAWTSRRERLGRDLEDVRGREREAAERRGQIMGELNPDEKALKAARAQHATIVAELEDIEAGIASVDERLRALDAERAQAERRRVITTAIAALDRAEQIAARVDAAWDPIRAEMVRLSAATEDVAAALKSTNPSSFATYEISKARLTTVLLWRVRDLLELPAAFGEQAKNAVELVAFRQERARLEAELNTPEGERT